jgi:predicted membrane chloride channel (bestrophin family)
MKIAAFQPQTALAAYAMGVAMQLTTSTSGEDIEYALVDLPNLQRFMQGEDQYDAFIWQGSVSVDAQRRQQPLAGTYAFALKNNNVLEGVEVMVEIEAILETPILEDELYLVPQ